MARRWCAFFERAPGKRSAERLARRVLLGFGIAAAISVAPLCLAAPAPSAAPIQDPAFLSLPTIELELVGPATSPSSPKMPKVGDELTLKMAGSFPPGAAVDLRTGDALEEQGWEVRPGSDGKLSVIPLQGGHLILPSLPIQDPSGKAIARTNPFSIDVTSAIPPDDKDPQKPADLAPPVGLGFPWVLLALIITFALAATGGLGYAVFRWIRILKARKNQPAPEPAKTEDEIALAALDQLRAEGLAEKGQFKRHYFRVSEILKAYLGARYAFDAPESTSFELVTVLEEGKWVSPAMLDRVESLFSRMDRVKFTDHLPEFDEALRILEDARGIVRETRKVLEPVVAVKGAR